MKNSNQAEKAKIFLELHKKNEPLILPNIWDSIGARILEANEYPAIATASAAVSASLGFEDGEKIMLSTHLEVIKKIVKSVEVPVTADIEAGYSSSLLGLNEVIEQVIDAGVVGINIEDSLVKNIVLRSKEEQAERITAVREVSNKKGIHLVINARVDSFLIKEKTSEDEKIEQTIDRAKDYIKAGADCIYPIGAKQKETLITLRKNIKSPINVLSSPDALSLKTLREIGINRISFGPFIFRSLIKKFEKIIRELRELKSYECFADEISSSEEINKYLIKDMGQS
ncbi:MAG: isocitrate lyase/phosphoenolpyruvate mutase family protein [Ignavibacteriaceae bacterium]